jgi:hypothetical protein
MSIKQLYAGHILRSKVRLDVPTSQDSAVRRQANFVAPSWGNKNVAWKTVLVLTNTLRMIIIIISQLLVMFTVLREQQGGLFLIIVGISQSVIFASTRNDSSSSLGRSIAVALTICLTHTCSLGCDHNQSRLYSDAGPTDSRS